MLAGLAMVTKHIGLTCTMTSTYTEPFNVARHFMSLDVMSGGRAAWNLVTSAQEAEAQNFNRTAHLAKRDRYRRAREYADVVLGLWRSWDDDAFVEDKTEGLFFDPDKLHLLNHKGEHFPGARTAERTAVTAGPSGDDPGWRIRGWARARGLLGQGDLCGNTDDR